MKTAAHWPRFITRKFDTDRWFCQCQTCPASSPPTTYRPLLDRWRRDHTKAAMPPRKAGR